MKALIIGIIGYESHEASVRDAFVLGYNEAGGNITASDVAVHSVASLNFQTEFDYCKTNNIPILINSYPWVTSKISVAQANYPDVTLFMPAGANSIGEIMPLAIPQVICITGAGDIANETGDNVEFISRDPIASDEQDYSSYSNGYIAGQIAFIADSLNCTIWEARFRAMMTGSENGIWHETNGYGFIDVSEAIAFNGTIASDPFITGEPLPDPDPDVDPEPEPVPTSVPEIVATVGVYGIRLSFKNFAEGLEKTIYRKNSSEAEYEVIAILFPNEYLDIFVTRQPKPYTYKIVAEGKEYLVDVMFCKINSVFVK